MSLVCYMITTLQGKCIKYKYYTCSELEHAGLICPIYEQPVQVVSYVKTLFLVLQFAAIWINFFINSWTSYDSLGGWWWNIQVKINFKGAKFIYNTYCWVRVQYEQKVHNHVKYFPRAKHEWWCGIRVKYQSHIVWWV